MKTQTRSQIIEIVKERGGTRPHDLAEILEITPAAVHRQLKRLCQDGLLERVGRPPHVFYLLTQVTPIDVSGIEATLSPQDRKFVSERYLYLDPTGKQLSGLEGLVTWARNKKVTQNLPALVEEYIRVRKTADAHYKRSRIEATQRFRSIFGSDLQLQKIYYQDFYSIPKFGKTQLGQLVLHGKQSQNKKMLSTIAERAKPVVESIIRDERLQAVAWVPHSLPRSLSPLKWIERKMGLPFPSVDLIKAYTGEIPVAQKSLSKLEERVANAAQTILVKSPSIAFQSLLLIDDAVGSGATLNEVARKLRLLGVKKIVGFSLVGSLKGFEVIREV